MFILEETTINLCTEASFLFKIIGLVITLVRYIVPVILIIMIIVDVTKTLSTSSPDTKGLINKSVTRFAFAAIIYLIPAMVTVILSNAGLDDTDGTSAIDALNCINQYVK